MRLGTRRSRLALTQSGMVATSLGADVSLVEIETEGDRQLEGPLQGPLAKGFFTEAIERALRAGTIDLAVHSLKDLPVDSPEDLVVAATPEREAAADLLLVRADAWCDVEAGLPVGPGARIGSTSPRRAALLAAWAPHAQVLTLRGNVTTRVERLREGRFEAILLAEAGLRRLGAFRAGGEVSLHGIRVFRLALPTWPCAPGQGSLGVQCRADDFAARSRIGGLHDSQTARSVNTERGWLARLGGGCTIPFGAWVGPDAWSFCLGVPGGLVLRSGIGDAAAGTAALDAALADPRPAPLSPVRLGVEVDVHAR